MTAPELMGHVAIPYKWNEFLFYQGCSFNVTSLQDSSLRKTNHLLHASHSVREESGDDPVIVYNAVPADCIYKVFSQKVKRTLFERLSTPRHAPKIVLKGVWQTLQQQQDTSESATSRTRTGAESGKRTERGSWQPDK